MPKSKKTRQELQTYIMSALLTAQGFKKEHFVNGIGEDRMKQLSAQSGAIIDWMQSNNVLNPRL